MITYPENSVTYHCASMSYSIKGLYHKHLSVMKKTFV